MSGYFGRLVQRFGVAPAPPGRRVAPAAAQHPLDQEEWRETAPPLRDAFESAAPRAEAVPAATAKLPADVFPRSVTQPQPLAIESSVGPSITPPRVTGAALAIEAAPVPGPGYVTPSAAPAMIETDALEEAPLPLRVPAGPSHASKPARRSPAVPEERRRGGRAVSPDRPASGIAPPQEPSSHRVQPQALFPTSLPAPVPARPQEELAARAAPSSHAPAPGASADDRHSPIEVRIGTVTLEVRGSPQPAPLARPALPAERREPARFSSSRYHLRWE